MKSKRLFVFLLLFLTTATAFAKDSLLPFHDPYGKILRRYSRQGDHYNLQDLYAQVIWHATYISDEFRDAFREEYNRVYPQGQDEKAAVRAAAWLNPGPQPSFFVGIYAKKRELKELGNEKSFQDLTLEVDGRYYKPSSIEKIPTTPFELYFFNYLNFWFQGYRVVFPYEGLHNRDKAFELHLNSVAGASKVKFKQAN